MVLQSENYSYEVFYQMTDYTSFLENKGLHCKNIMVKRWMQIIKSFKL